MTRRRSAGGVAHLHPASRYPEQPALHPGKRETAGESSGRVVSPGNGRRDEWFVCPNEECGSSALGRTIKVGRDDRLKALWKCLDCGWGLDEISQLLGVPRWRMLELGDPPAELGPALERSTRRRRSGDTPEDPPSEGAVSGAVAHLWSAKEARYARRELARRGFSAATLHAERVGYGDSFWRRCPKAFKFPVFDEHGMLVGYKERFWPQLWSPSGARKESKSRSLAGSSWLYPGSALNAGTDELLIVCEGEFDALLLNHHGFAAITSTASTSWKSPDWNRWIVGRRVAVLYDKGSIALSRKRANEFREAGAANAWAVDWPDYFNKNEDVGDWFVRYDHNAGDLWKLILTERRRSS
jgi:hypothetical protein